MKEIREKKKVTNIFKGLEGVFGLGLYVISTSLPFFLYPHPYATCIKAQIKVVKLKRLIKTHIKYMRFMLFY